MGRTFIARLRPGAVLFVSLWLSAASSLGWAADGQKTPRELIQYIEDAKRLGLKENEIRQNAITAGWSKELVGQALAIVRYMGEDVSTRKGESPDRKTVEPAGYRIGAGDVLQILVWKEPDASVPSVMVRTDGKISVPLIKEVNAAGLTPAELEKVLAERLSKFVREVDVTVIPREIVSQKVYLLGAIRREGPVVLQSSMTVLQALNSAGGLTEYAKRKKIYILRNENGKQIRLPFDYEAVIKGEHPEQNILVQAEDTIVVP
ncbi:MAG: polysaccharide biosynthesis/export family protein [Bryobacterales bacterium]|nr:polysaccharide biosynthesis/export family protein [Bryobacterales bacterium]